MYRKTPKISPGAYIFQRPFLRGLWGLFSEYKPPGAYIWRGDLTEGLFLRYRLRGLVFGEAYTWRGLFSEFYGMLKPHIVLNE